MGALNAFWEHSGSGRPPFCKKTQLHAGVLPLLPILKAALCLHAASTVEVEAQCLKFCLGLVPAWIAVLVQFVPITTGLLFIYRLGQSFSCAATKSLSFADVGIHHKRTCHISCRCAACMLPSGNSWMYCQQSFMLVPAGKGVDAAILQQTAEMVRQTCMTCSRAMRAEGIKVLELISKDLEQLSHITCEHQRSRVTHTLQVGRLQFCGVAWAGGTVGRLDGHACCLAGMWHQITLGTSLASPQGVDAPMILSCAA